jgi:hypothetical protein
MVRYRGWAMSNLLWGYYHGTDGGTEFLTSTECGTFCTRIMPWQIIFNVNSTKETSSSVSYVLLHVTINSRKSGHPQFKFWSISL